MTRPPTAPRPVRSAGTAVGLAALAALAVLSGLTCSRPPARPNVILISFDSLRPDHLQAYGYHRPTSPHIDAIAASGALFENAFSSTSWTLPAHMALFTSLPNRAHGVDDNDLPPLDPLRTTLAEQFRAAGYATAGFISGPYLHPAFGFDRGFDQYVNCSSSIDPARFADPSFVHFDAGPHQASHSDITNPTLFGKVAAWLQDTSRDRPFFLFVHVWDIHYDYIPPEPYDRMFDPDYQGTLDPTDFEHNPAIHRGMPARDLEHLKALYDGEIRATDDYIGRLIAQLEALGIRDETLLVLTADHGEEFFEHGGKGHQKTLFDEVLRIPLIFSWPGQIGAGTRVATQARIIDIAPTLAELCRLAPNPQAAGRSLVPALAGRGEDLPVFADLNLRASQFQQRALRQDGTKIIWSEHHARDFVFGVTTDPAEQSPLAASDPRVAAARRELDAATRAIDALAASLPASGERAPVELDEESRERLRSLGYLGAP